jgi:hypothetical protein
MVNGKNMKYELNTYLENLQVLCARHNLAKGNLEYSEKS